MNSLILKLSLIFLLLRFTEEIGNNGNYTCGPMYITISASPRASVVLNWHFTCENPPDKLLLLLTDSRTYEQIQDSVNVRGRIEGTYKTKFLFPQNPDLPGNWNKNDQNPGLDAHCLPLVIESLRNGNLVDRKCLEIQPTWMSKYSKLRLGSIMIPGTHNSGSYRGQPILLQNYVLCQDRSWWQQLVFGIRYFDLRVGVYENDDVFITHGIARCTPLDIELDSVADFLRKSPREIVIIDVHAFNNPVNFTMRDHRVILNLMKNKLGRFIYPRHELHYDEGPTLEEIWTGGGGRVIISYNKRYVVNDNHWLWYQVSRDWGNVIAVDKLQNYIYEKTDRKSYGNPMKVLMAELTPTKVYVIFHPISSLKNLADDINPHLGFWLRYQNRSDNINIIATDFFLGNDMINLAQETNDRKMYRLTKS